jgi:hypothetical protein
MGMFTKVSEDIFRELQIDAGVILTSFDPAAPVEPSDSNIVTATTGGITVSCVPTYSDMFEDVDNAPINTMEGKHLDGWTCTLSTTALGTTANAIKIALGAADTATGNTAKIVPRKDLKQTDFQDLWWVGDKADGGLVAVKIKNALSTGGFVLKTTKNGKGNVTLEITGHVSVESQSDMPMEFYSLDGIIDVLTVVSAAGTTAGTTKLTITGHTLGESESYVYKVGDAAETVNYGDSLAAWTDWNGTADIEAATGKKITVAVVDASDKAVAAGSATVVSASA